MAINLVERLTRTGVGRRLLEEAAAAEAQERHRGRKEAVKAIQRIEGERNEAQTILAAVTAEAREDHRLAAEALQLAGERLRAATTAEEHAGYEFTRARERQEAILRELAPQELIRGFLSELVVMADGVRAEANPWAGNERTRWPDPKEAAKQFEEWRAHRAARLEAIRRARASAEALAYKPLSDAEMAGRIGDLRASLLERA